MDGLSGATFSMQCHRRVPLVPRSSGRRDGAGGRASRWPWGGSGWGRALETGPVPRWR